MFNIKTISAFLIGMGCGYALCYYLDYKNSYEVIDNKDSDILSENSHIKPDFVGITKENENKKEELLNIKEDISKMSNIIEDNYVDKKETKVVELLPENYFDNLVDDHTEYDTQQLLFYVNNNLVVDDAYGEIMEEAFNDDVIGTDILNSIKNAESNDDVFYVRNNRLMIDYEIYRTYEDYIDYEDKEIAELENKIDQDYDEYDHLYDEE